MKRLICVILAIGLVLIFSSCATAKYRESDFIGKTSAEIEAEFGAFDCCQNHAGADGIYRNASCGYTIREPRKVFLGTDPEILFFISFDENGIAYKCYEGYRPGG